MSQDPAHRFCAQRHPEQASNGGRFKVRLGDNDGYDQCTSSRSAQGSSLGTSALDLWWTTYSVDSDYYTDSESEAEYCDAPNVCGIPDIDSSRAPAT